MKSIISVFLILTSVSISLSQDVVRRMWVDPYVITDPSEDFSFRMEINVEDNGIDSLLVEMSNTQNIISLYDNGIGNDEVANDNIFSSVNLTNNGFGVVDDSYPVPAAFSYKVKAVTAFTDGVLQEQITEGSFDIRGYTPDVLPQVKVISSTIQHTSHVVNIVDEDLESIFDDRTEVARRYYEIFPDDRHTLMYSSTETSWWTPSYVAASFRYANDVEGIGISIADASDMFYSENVEQIIMFNNGSESNGVFFHELHHRWGISLPQEWRMNSGGHWSGANSLDGSGFGGIGFSRIEPLGNDLYNLYYTELEYKRFNSLDMYLAGYGSIDDVNFPITVLPEWTYIEDNADGSVRVSAEEMITVTKEEFIDKLGLRIPSYENSRKTQNLAMIVRSQRLLTADELAYFHTIMVEHEKTEGSIYSPESYYDRTFEKGRLNTRIANFNSTSVADREDNAPAVSLYPNPASSYLNIKTEEKINSYSVINTLGKVIIKGGKLKGKGINISKLMPGTYILKYDLKGSIKSNSFLKL